MNINLNDIDVQNQRRLVDQLLQGSRDILQTISEIEVHVAQQFEHETLKTPLAPYDFIYNFLLPLYCRAQIILSPIRVHLMRQFRKGQVRTIHEPQLRITRTLQRIVSEIPFIDLINETRLTEIAHFLYHMNSEVVSVIYNQEMKYVFKGFQESPLYYSAFLSKYLHSLTEQFEMMELTVPNVVSFFNQTKKFSDQICPFSWKIVLSHLIAMIVNVRLPFWSDQVRQVTNYNQLYQIFNYYQQYLDNQQYTQSNHLMHQLSIRYQGKIFEQLQQSCESKLPIVQQANELLAQIQGFILHCEKYNEETFNGNKIFNFQIKQAVAKLFTLDRYLDILIVLIDKTLFEGNMIVMDQIIEHLQYVQFNNAFIQKVSQLVQFKQLNSIQFIITPIDNKFLEGLRHHFNNVQLHQLEVIYQDCLSSQRYISDDDQLQAKCLILSNQIWNITQINNFQFQNRGIQYLKQQFLSQYKSIYNNREIQICDCFAKAVIKYKINGSVYNIYLYATQLIILMQYQNQDIYDMQTLFYSTGLERPLFEAELKKLAEKQILIIERDQVKVNLLFEHPKSNISLLQKRFVQLEQQNTETSMNLKSTIQAYIIKKLKVIKSISHSELIQQVLDKFPTFGNSKLVIEDLIDLNYLKRDDTQLNVIIYNPA